MRLCAVAYSDGEGGKRIEIVDVDTMEPVENLAAFLWGPREALTQPLQHGMFEAANLPPGEYLVVVVPCPKILYKPAPGEEIPHGKEAIDEEGREEGREEDDCPRPLAFGRTSDANRTGRDGPVEGRGGSAVPTNGRGNSGRQRPDEKGPGRSGSTDEGT